MFILKGIQGLIGPPGPQGPPGQGLPGSKVTFSMRKEFLMSINILAVFWSDIWKTADEMNLKIRDLYLM